MGGVAPCSARPPGGHHCGRVKCRFNQVLGRFNADEGRPEVRSVPVLRLVSELLDQFLSSAGWFNVLSSDWIRRNVAWRISSEMSEQEF